ncbi:hypothetical protein QBE55_13280 [Eubacteriales bacterium mix99]|jgi:hypothetical protein
MKKKGITVLFLVGSMLLASSCNKKTETPDSQKGRPACEVKSESSESDHAAYAGSSFLKQMDDLKAINLAANYLKELGETVSFQETYIEFHKRQKTAVQLPVTDGKPISYPGDYLEVRLYRGEDRENPCEECTTVYISQNGKILGQNKWSANSPKSE